MALDPIAETQADTNSYGFRKSRSTADARDQAFNILSKNDCAEWVLEGDIMSCFDNISHLWLEKNIPLDGRVLAEWLKAGVISNGMLFPTAAGTPQGGIISPTLANMTLDGLERMLNQKFRRRYWRDEVVRNKIRSYSPKVKFVRYADDFIVTGTSKEVLETEVKPAIVEFLKERGLELSMEKTRVVHIETGFDFLGWNFRKYKGKLLIKPSKKNVHAFLAEIRETIDANKTAKAANLIAKLNPKIQGWANYHKGAVAKEAFAQVDKQIWEKLWQWALRRHSEKRPQWIKDKYFMREGNRDWIFFGGVILRNGEKGRMKLINAADTKIVRHTKIKGNANPYCPKDEIYFEKREVNKMAEKLDGRRKVRGLWLDQGGTCPVCKQRIENVEDGNVHIHHIIERCHGGTSRLENLVLLHPECHRQVHSQGKTVKKPARSESRRL
jgi:RNA-directed DNA polymerase